MDFPVSIPWETLDPEILQKAINSGSNYRTYCDEKSWDISFEIEFLEKEEIIFLLLVEHGRRKGGTSVHQRQVCLETMCMNPIWTICIPGITWATEFFCPIIMNVNYILCNPIPMLQ